MDQLPFVVDVYQRDLRIEDYFIGWMLHPYISIYTGRGCKSRCTFCLWPQTIGGHNYRTRSPLDRTGRTAEACTVRREEAHGFPATVTEAGGQLPVEQRVRRPVALDEASVLVGQQHRATFEYLPWDLLAHRHFQKRGGPPLVTGGIG